MMQIVPYALLAPYVFRRQCTLGDYMQAVTAFKDLQESLSIFVQNWVSVNELLSVMRRLREFENALPPRGVDSADVGLGPGWAGLLPLALPDQAQEMQGSIFEV